MGFLEQEIFERGVFSDPGNDFAQCLFIVFSIIVGYPVFPHCAEAKHLMSSSKPTGDLGRNVRFVGIGWPPQHDIRRLRKQPLPRQWLFRHHLSRSHYFAHRGQAEFPRSLSGSYLRCGDSLSPFLVLIYGESLPLDFLQQQDRIFQI